MADVFQLFKNGMSWAWDLANTVNFYGLNLWDISFIVFTVSLIFRFLFPLVLHGQGGVPFIRHGKADSVNEKPVQTNGQIEGSVPSWYYQQKGGRR